jgi:Cation transporter/ATPase, N-terminus
MAFQWPHSIGGLFLRRCPISQATHIAVEAPTKKVTSSSNLFSYGLLVVKMIWYPFDLFLSIVFSYPHVKEEYETSFCKVCMSKNGSRSFYFRMGRYVFDPESGTFIPGIVAMGQSVGDLVSHSNGLSTEQAAEHFEIVGSNIILMEKPTMLGSVWKEFSKSFYVYQNFMVWTWFPYWYYYMALIHTFVRVTGGLVVAYFQYMSDSVHHRLSIVEGEIEYVMLSDSPCILFLS